MHILILPSYYPSDINPITGIFFRDQAYALRKAGLQVGVVAPIIRSLKYITPRQGDLFLRDQKTIESGVPTYRRYAWNWLPRIPYGSLSIFMAAGESAFGRYVADNGLPDLIHAHVAEYAGILASQIKAKYGVPFVITEHSTAYALGLIPKWRLSLIRKAYLSANARIVVSPALGKALEDCMGKAASPWVWIPNFVSPHFSIPLHSKRNSDVFRFLNIGFLVEKKGQSYLLQAFRKFFINDSHVELRIGGEGPLRRSLKQLAIELGIDRQVVFLGPLNRAEVVSEMQSADVFVLPSTYETFGVVLIEAMACGKPVVATVCGGPEYIVDQGCGLLVAPRDTDALGEAMFQMRTQISKYDPEKIRVDCLAKFGDEALISQLLKIYEGV